MERALGGPRAESSVPASWPSSTWREVTFDKLGPDSCSRVWPKARDEALLPCGRELARMGFRERRKRQGSSAGPGKASPGGAATETLGAVSTGLKSRRGQVHEPPWT